MESNIRYLFIDDDSQKSLVDKINRSTTRLKIKREPPKSFDQMIKMFSPREFDYNGLIIDLRLNDRREVGQDFPVNYRPTAVVQELRSRAAESLSLGSEFPIILLSDETNISSLYNKDKSSHDLFDIVCSKDEVSNNPKLFALQLAALYDGYTSIVELRGTTKASLLDTFLIDASKEAVSIDPRITHNFDNKDWRVTAHEYANFILHQIIEKQGSLINEAVLAARLGIDITSSKDWGKLKSKIDKPVKYKGVFAGGWDRWWANRLEDWWDSVIKEKKVLKSVPASKRVELLKDKLGFKGLVASKPITKDYSDYFWTICKARQLPLDPANGFIVNMDEPKPWQDREYISQIAAIKKEEGIKVHPMEIPRLKLLLKK